LSRRVGLLCAAAGLAHWALVVLHPGSAAYYAHFLLFTLGGLGYLTAGYARTRLFLIPPLVDLLLGIGGFVLLLPLMAWRTAALTPGLFLLVYGCAKMTAP
jgi:hypothetical protein